MEDRKELIDAFTSQVSFYDWDRYTNPSKPSNIRLRQVVEKDLEEYLLPGSVFELAAGTGYWGRYLLDRGYDYSGVEITPAMVEEAWRKNVLTEKLGDARYLDVYPSNLDNIICIKALTFIGSADKVIQNCSKALHPGGRLVFWYYNKDFYILDLILKLQGKPSVKAQTPLETRYGWNEMKFMLKDNNFRIIRMYDCINFSYRFLPRFLRDNRVIHWIDNHLRFGWITVVIAELGD